jgi:hypothetical protein
MGDGLLCIEAKAQRTQTMARDEVIGRKAGIVESMGQDARGIRGSPQIHDFDAYSIAEFCRRHGVSVQLFYKMRDEMPATFRLGSRVLVSREAAVAWRAKREAAEAEITIS